jgi:Tfp pilus assembly protein PilN
VRAVNLIGVGAGREGQSAGPWVVLAVLGLLVVGMLAYVLTNNEIAGDRAQLTSLQTQVQAIQANADAVRPYKEFAALAQARVETIRQLGAARFDWHRTFADLAHVIPGDVALSSLLGTVAPGVGVQGGGSGDTGTLRSALPNPAIELSGCTAGHDGVARLISRLRSMTGVVRVSLSGSTEAPGGTGGTGATGATGTGAQSSGGCPLHGVTAEFGIVVFFQPIPAVPAPTQPDLSGGAAGAPAASTAPPAAPAGSAAPAASTTPAPSAGGAPTGTAATTPSGTGTGNGSAAP